MKKIGVYLLCAGLMISQSGCSPNTDLFQMPAKRGESMKTPKQGKSTLTITTRIPYSAINASIERNMPGSISFSGKKDDCLCANHPAIGSKRQCIQVPYLDFRGAGMREQCINVPAIIQKRACAGCSWRGSINRVGGINLESAKNATTVSQLLNISGKAGVRGDLANILSLSGKSFNADLNPTFDLTFDLDRNWCPVVSVRPHQNWVTSASVEVIGRSCIGIDLGPLGHPETCAGPADIDLTSQANDEISKNMSSVVNTIKNSIPCDAIKKEMSKHWRSLSIPIKLPQGDVLHLNITPKNAAFSGFIPEVNGLGVSVLVGATTSVESNPIPESRIPLPSLERANSQASSLKIDLPLHVPYSVIEKAIGMEVKNKDFIKQTDVGKVKIYVNDVSVYPSDERLTIGLNINAVLPGHILDTNGWVYFLGTPKVINSGAGIRVDDIKYATVLDNEFWDAASSVFNEYIISYLRESSTIDLSSTIEEYEDTVSQQINSTKIDGLKIASKSTKIAIQRLNVYDQGLQIILNLDERFEADMTAIDF